MGGSTAAHGGVLVFLPLILVVHCWGGWSLTYTSSQICAFEGSTVDISCSFTYPSGNGRVQRTKWLTEGSSSDLREDSKYFNRVQHHCSQNTCTLTIRNVTKSDSTVYRFRFITEKYSEGFTGSPGVSLTVTDLKAMIKSYSNTVPWQCKSECPSPDQFSYIWYENGQKIRGRPFTSSSLNSRNSYSCAAEGHEDFPSPPECDPRNYCNKVIYTTRNICAVKGSTVHIRCRYQSVHQVTSAFWFSPGRSRQWLNSSQPETLKRDPQFSGRVTDNTAWEWGSSTLTIRDVRPSDSAEYHFTYKTQSFEWRSRLPGTTLTVTDPELQVKLLSWSSWSSWGQFECSSRCALPSKSFVWYKNGLEIHTGPHYSGSFKTKDSISCALTDQKDFPSPPVCAHGERCNRVIYPARRICAAEGSAVEISCFYHSYDTQVSSKFWFRSEDTQRTQRLMDIRGDSRFAERVEVLEGEQGFSMLRIRGLNRRDTAQYRFRFETRNFQWPHTFPGTSLTVTALQVKVIRGGVPPSDTEAELQCHSSCQHAARLLYVWFRNGQRVTSEGLFYRDRFRPGDAVSCALRGHENYTSPPVYVLEVPTVSVSPTGEITEGVSVTLTCHGNSNSAVKRIWYKDARTVGNSESQLFLRSIKSSDSGRYHCTAENEFGRTTSQIIVIDVQYGPKRPSVSVRPSAEIMEGSSVTLTCSSDANPAANSTWYKGNQTLAHGPAGVHQLSSIRPEDGGHYRCMSVNRHGHESSSLFVDVQYGPKHPSVSVRPSAEIMEGSSVTLTCSSDANPAASYTWYKEGEDSPAAAGQNFTIISFTPEHSGNYSCEARNSRGHKRSSVFLSVAQSVKAAAAGASTAVILLLILVFVFLFLRKRKIFKGAAEPAVTAGSREQQEDRGELQYASVHFSAKQEAVYGNVLPARPHGRVQEDGAAAVYSAVRFKRDAGAADQAGGEDPSALYSTVNKLS